MEKFYLVIDEGQFENYEEEMSSQEEAVNEAKKIAKKRPNANVFVKFVRGSDGQVGYINDGEGAAITGKSW